jgi:hypothetical protein
LPFGFKLSPEGIRIGNDEFQANELVDLKIDADDFMGGPGGDILSSSIGTENFIEFSYRGQKHEYQFLVKRKSDLQLIEQIYKELNKLKAV